jgi:hypothetical protein
LAFGPAVVDVDGVGWVVVGRWVARGATGPARRARGGGALRAVAVRAVHAGVLLAHALPVAVLAAAVAVASAAGAGADVGFNRRGRLRVGAAPRIGGIAFALILVWDC